MKPEFFFNHEKINLKKGLKPDAMNNYSKRHANLGVNDDCVARMDE